MNSQNLTLRTKLGLAFGLMVALIMLVSGISIKDLNDGKTQFHDFVTGINARAHLAQQVRTAVDQRAIAARNLVLATQPADRDTEKAAVTKAHEDVQLYLKQLKAAIDQPGIPATVKAVVADIDKIETAYGPVALNIVNLALSDKKEEAITKINTECRPLLQALIAKTNEYQAVTDERSKRLVETSEKDFGFQRNALVVLALVATVLAVLSGLLITRNVL
jgi:methyl-accepting chemotaxis protein-1 (serine sensor receptor)